MNHLYLKGLNMYIDEQLVTGTYTVDFYANKTLFKKLRLQADGGGAILFYDEEDAPIVIAQSGAYVPANNLYRYIQIDIDSCPDNLKKFLSYSYNITNYDNGYFNILNNIDYRVNINNSPDNNIVSSFEDRSENIWPVFVTPITKNYWSENFNEKLYDSLYLSFSTNTVKYITVKNGSKLDITNDLFYNSIFYVYRNNGTKRYLKFVNLETDTEYYLVGTKTGDRYYIELKESIGTNIEVYYGNDNYLYVFDADNEVLYSFDGTSTHIGKLNTTTSYTDKVIVNNTPCVNSNYQPSININYSYLNQANSCKAFYNDSIEVNINGTNTRKLPYELFNSSNNPDVQISNDNINWINVNHLYYILPNYTYYKTGFILDAPVISLNNNIVSWNSIESALGYKVKLIQQTESGTTTSEDSVSSGTTSYTLNTSITGLIKITVNVKALGNNLNIYDSQWSNQVSWKAGVILTIKNNIHKNDAGYILSDRRYLINYNQENSHTLTYDAYYYIGFRPMGSSEFAPGWTEADKQTHIFSLNISEQATDDVAYTLNQSGSVAAKSYIISCQGTYSVGKTIFTIPTPFDYNPDDYYSNGYWKSDNSKVLTIIPPVALGTPSSIDLNPLTLSFNGDYTTQEYSFEVNTMKISKPNINISK